ncbi:Aculeacin-A acylase [Halioglobus japonicus]|nr:Aculeacin-A acylase [Halioglobus japonicus]
MNTMTPSWKQLVSAALCSLMLTACSDSSDNNNNDDNSDGSSSYSADIVWTEYGIPHITAEDYGSAGYGVGYAYARENFCTVMQEYVRAAGESSRYLGDDGDLNSDFVMKLYNSDERIARMIEEDLPDYIVENLSGYAAGINRYLAETGVDNLAEGDEGCRGAAWVREIELEDVVRLVHRAILYGSALPLTNYIVAAEPSAQAAQIAIPEGMTSAGLIAANLSQAQFDAGIDLPKGGALGSNAYGVGAQASQTDMGILLGNPHFPWQGPQRFFMFHVTLGDEYDMMGAALGGLPAPVIGFNRDVAWSHTVSTASRFNFYELELNPDNPLEYLYDGEFREITSETVSVERAGAGGELETIEHTFYFSHYGAIINLGGINSLLDGWPTINGSVLTYFDANLENLRGLDQWINMGKSKNLGEFKDALRSMGIPWVNTIAADRHGDAFYGDISVTPHITTSQVNNCVRGLLQSSVTDFGYITLDGSDSSCEAGSDAGTVAGIFGYDSLPKLETREYGANANDSYWLSNPRMLLEGFPPIIGEERVEQTRRTRATFSQAENRLAGSDGLGTEGFNIDNIRQLLYNSTNFTAELILDDVLTICRGEEENLPEGISMTQQACDLLGGWDRTHQIDSVGGHIFTEFWKVLRSTPNLWAVPFDAADPVNTPRDLNDSDPAVVAAVQNALEAAVNTLADAGIALDAQWGEVQFVEKNGERIPIHGGSSDMMFSVITSNLVEGEGYSGIRHGNSYIQAVTWDQSDCPDAFAILTYSQSTDPASEHYADATKLYSNGGWIDMAFCEADRDAQEIGRQTITQ